MYFNKIFASLALIVISAYVVPLSPSMPGHGLDPSWIMGLNEAVGKGLAFGREVIFTYGPYASVFTKTYHPATDSLMVFGSVYLALILWACLVYLVAQSKVNWVYILPLLLFIVGIEITQDVLLFSIPLIIAICVHKFVFGEHFCPESRGAQVFVIAICSCLGFLPLIKGSVFPYSFAVLMAIVTLFVSKRIHALALFSIASALLSLIIFWRLSGQSLVDLPSYIVSMLPIVSGYSESMAMSGGPMEEVYVYILASVVLLISILAAVNSTLKSKIFLLFVFGGFIFVSFKSGFVRHDAHALTSGGAILVAALLFPLAVRSRFALHVIFSGIVVWMYIDSHHLNVSTSRLIDNVLQTHFRLVDALGSRLMSDDHLRSRYESHKVELRSKANLPTLNGTSDIYPVDISRLIASGNTWNPRPVFQSYSVYHPYLADVNIKHLSGQNAPNNIIFKVSPIDWRMPSIEDGASWPILLTKFRPIEFNSEFLFLERLDRAPMDVGLNNRTESLHSLGEVVEIPKANAPVFAQVHIKPKLAGRLAKLFYKSPGLLINIKLEDGSERKFRIPPGLVSSNFLLNPLVENTAEFGLLYGVSGYLDLKAVKSISVDSEAADSGINFWNENYSLVLQEMQEFPKYNMRSIFKFDEFREMFGVMRSKQRTLSKCFGNIDVVNGVTPTPASSKARQILTVNGWLVASVEDALLPDETYLVLTDSSGRRQYLRAKSEIRPDVGNYFGDRRFDEAGFRGKGDISALNRGEYKLSLAMLVAGEMLNCPEFHIPITLGE